MNMPSRVEQFLTGQHIPYDTVSHSPSHSSVQSAIAAQIPLHKLAKAIILRDQVDNYLMALVPAANRVKVSQVNQLTDSVMHMATEREIGRRFSDCQKGAIPPLGTLYNMEMVWDNRLGKEPDLYMEAGDHETLIHIGQQAFQQIVSGSLHDNLCSSPAH